MDRLARVAYMEQRCRCLLRLSDAALADREAVHMDAASSGRLRLLGRVPRAAWSIKET